MRDINGTVTAFNKLNISEIPNDWIQAVIESDFSDAGDELPDEFAYNLRETNYHGKDLEALKKALKPWLVETQDDEQGLWTVLVENDIAYKSALCLLAHLMDSTQKRAAEYAKIVAGLEAAGVYLTFLMVPGSGAFKLFHPVLFEKVTNCFKLWKRISTPQRKRQNSGLSDSQPQASQGRGRKRARNLQPEEEENEDEEEGMLTSNDLTRINKKLFTFLKTFVEFLATYSLSQADEAVYSSVHILAELSKMEAETFMGNFSDDLDIERMRTVPELCFHGLDLLCTKAHGDVPTMLSLVLKALLPSLLMLIGENKAVAAQSVPRQIKLIKDHALNFVIHLMKSKKEGIQSAVRVLVQQLCARVTDRTEYRTLIAEAIVNIMRQLPSPLYARLIEWIYRFGRTNKLSSRVFALEMACLLVQEPEREDVGVGEEAVFATHNFLIQMLLSRCSDVAPTVRARAITGFATCVSSSLPHVTRVVQDMMTPSMSATAARPTVTRVIPTPEAQRTETARPDNTTDCHMTESTNEADTVAMEGDSTRDRRSRTSLDTAMASLHMQCRESPFVTVQLTPGVEITIRDGAGVASMLRRRVRDEKVNVRKAALHAMESLVRLDKQHINAQDVSLIADSCRDPSLMVRKQAMSSLTELLSDIPRDPSVHKMFLSGMLPMVLDREATASEKCVNTCADIFLRTIVPYDRSTEDCHMMVWELLDIVSSSSGTELRRYLAKCCAQWMKAGLFNKQLIESLKTHVNTQHNLGAWTLLSEITAFYPKISADFVLDYWTYSASQLSEENHLVVHEVLTVLGHISKQVNPDRISHVTADLKVRLMQFNLPPALVSVTVSTLSKLCEALTGDAGSADAMTKTWFVDLLNASDRYLSGIILSENPEEALEEDTIICHLFTLGEIAQLCPDKTPKRVFLLIQSLISTPVITSIDGSSQVPPSQTHSESAGPLVTPDVSSIRSSQNSSQASSQGDSQSVFGFSQGSQATQVLSQFRGSRMPPKIRPYAFIALGKLCLQHEDIAKKCVAAMARELEICPDPAVRNNVVIIMCDLCIRYTQLVDSYVGRVSACLKDDSALIRKQTLNLLTHLLQEDYIKWKDALFYRFSMALIDDVQDIQDFAEFCLVHLLSQRHPDMFYQHFVECIFHFNSYEGHKVYNKFYQTEKEKKSFSLRGQNNFKKRERIYRFLLTHMTDEQRFLLSGKLCHDVLGAVVDEVIPYDAHSAVLMQDALQILCFKEIKLASLKAQKADDAETELEMAQAVMHEARKKVITQVVKTNVIENIVPTVISLKHLLEKKRSEVLRELMLYLCELMKDYKTEVQDILSADRQLACEIEFDLRKFEEREQADREAERARQQQIMPQHTPLPPGMSPRPLTPRSLAAGSPRTPGRGSPRGGAPGTPHTPRTPRAPGTPRTPGQPSTPAPGTPGRNVSLAALAMINSARKLVQRTSHMPAVRGTPIRSARPTPSRANTTAEALQGRAEGTRERAQGTPTKVRATPSHIPPSPQAPPQKKVAFSKSVDERDPVTETPAPDTEPSPEADHDILQTPQAGENRKPRENLTRAISTPTANLTFSNITFMDPNASMIPPSPIPSELPTVIIGAGSPRWAKHRVVDPVTHRVQERDVLHMMSPDKPAPKPRTWNVRAPSTQHRPQDRETPIPVPNKQPTNQPSATAKTNTPKSMTSKSTKNSQPKDPPANAPKHKGAEKNTEVKIEGKPLEEINTSTGRTRRSSRNTSKNVTMAMSDVSMDTTENSVLETSSRRRSARNSRKK